MDTDTVIERPDTHDRRANAVRAYHARTAHGFEGFAAGPDTLDWDAQPAPFRHYDGCPTVDLPRLDSFDSAHLHRPFAALGAAGPVQALTLAHLGALLQLAFGLTAWKSFGPDRWALRANPSSGNLHPVEAWAISRGVPGLADGVHHYRPERHALSLRAEDRVVPDSNSSPTLAVALSSVMWREAWKYGERAFRYCQLDVGHALGSLRYAAAVLGWTLVEQRQLGHETIAMRLGLDRIDDYPVRRHAFTEREEPEVVLSVGLGQQPPALEPGFVRAAARSARWHGIASTIDAHPMYRWPVIGEVAALTRRDDGTALSHTGPGTASTAEATGPAAVDLILQRRSAQRFDHRHVMGREALASLLERLDATLAVPFDLLAEQAQVALVVMVHRVADLSPGLYLVDRRVPEALPRALVDAFHEFADLAPVPGLPLRELRAVAPAVLKRVARSLNCHQDIAANSCLTIAMVAPLETAVAADPAAYRDLHRAAGLIGQALYLGAESLGLRGTGIGCFFDGPVRETLSLEASGLTTLYHFTLGRALDDTRLETTPAYAGVDAPAPTQEDCP